MREFGDVITILPKTPQQKAFATKPQGLRL
jgi:hypothetical protein